MSLEGHPRNTQISGGIPTRTLKWNPLNSSGVNAAASKAGRILPKAPHLELSFYWPLGVIGMSHHGIREWDNWRAPAESDLQRDLISAVSTECFRRNRILLLSRKYLKPQRESTRAVGVVRPILMIMYKRLQFAKLLKLLLQVQQETVIDALGSSFLSLLHRALSSKQNIAPESLLYSGPPEQSTRLQIIGRSGSRDTELKRS